MNRHSTAPGTYVTYEDQMQRYLNNPTKSINKSNKTKVHIPKPVKGGSNNGR